MIRRVLQWLNANGYRRYPFVEDTSAVMIGPGGVEVALPDDCLLDIQFTDYWSAAGDIRLQTIEVVSGGLQVVFAHADGVAQYTANVPANGAWPYRLHLTSGDWTMHAVFGRGVATIVDSWASGTYTAASDLRVEPALLCFQGRHRVASVCGDSQTSVPVAGDVFWQAGYSMRIFLQPAIRGIMISPVPGAGRGYSCEQSEADRANCDDILLLVNGASAGASGHFPLFGRNGVSVEPRPDRHEIIVRTNAEPFDIDCRSREG